MLKQYDLYEFTNINDDLNRERTNTNIGCVCVFVLLEALAGRWLKRFSACLHHSKAPAHTQTNAVI